MVFLWCFLAGELKNPGENIPKCVITALTLVALIYLLVNISYLAVLTPKEIMSSGTATQNQREDTLCPILVEKGGL